MLTAFLIPKKWEGLAPITLAREEPVAEFELDLLFAFSILTKPVNDLLLGVLGFEVV